MIDLFKKILVLKLHALFEERACFHLFVLSFVHNCEIWQRFIYETEPNSIGKVDNEPWKLTEQKSIKNTLHNLNNLL